MVKKLILLLVLLTPMFFVACGSPYGYHHRYRDYSNGYGYQNDAYQIGYQRGFELGRADRRAGEDFDYDDGDLYKHGISRDRYINDQFRQGFKRGYADAYYGQYYRQ